MTLLELTLSKIPDQRKPPRRRSLTLASQQKSFLCISDFARARFFLLKGKGIFLLGSALTRGRRATIFARTARHSSPQPPPAEPSSPKNSGDLNL